MIKLTEAALRQHRRTGDATLLVAAERFRGRLSPARRPPRFVYPYRRSSAPSLPAAAVTAVTTDATSASVSVRSGACSRRR